MPILRKVNKDFFKRWTPEMAYVLGFFAADGYIMRTRRGADFWCIQITDKELLQNIKKAIGSNHKISTRFRTGRESTIYRLQIGSKEMCADLASLGFTERKAKRMLMPNIPGPCFPHFVRGYFDGDGNIWTGRIHKDRARSSWALLAMFTSGSTGFLADLLVGLQKAGLSGGSIYVSSRGYGRLQFSTRDSLKLSDFMYNQPYPRGLSLLRKRRVFEKYRKCSGSSTG